MSKIGKINISIPEKVKVVLTGNLLNVEGPLGKKSLNIDTNVFELKIDEGKSVSIKPKNLNQDTKRLWGMNRSLLNNAIIGTSKGYSKTLELSGVGYRASIKGKQLSMQLGFSHDVNFDIPDSVKIIVEKQTIVKISGSDKQEVGMIASKIKSFRPPEPYKGKGIKEQGQYILRKEGKKK
jgi:large subunit ribosomal protein L6|tara:strand:+ start:1830 stop:2369 length:540 start_codon:yes stop_codon:yes gene_type:complete